MSKVLKTIKGIETFEKLEDVYSYLRKDVKYKEKKIEIVYNQETKEYIIEIYNEKETNYEKEIDINVDMEVVYGDTDSIMIRMKYNRDDFIQNRKDSFKLGEECARILTDDIFNRKPIEMEAENIYNPFIMLTRKRYTGSGGGVMPDSTACFA